MQRKESEHLTEQKTEDNTKTLKEQLNILIKKFEERDADTDKLKYMRRHVQLLYAASACLRTKETYDQSPQNPAAYDAYDKATRELENKFYEYTDLASPLASDPEISAICEKIDPGCQKRDYSVASPAALFHHNPDKDEKKSDFYPANLPVDERKKVAKALEGIKEIRTDLTKMKKSASDKGKPLPAKEKAQLALVDSLIALEEKGISDSRINTAGSKLTHYSVEHVTLGISQTKKQADIIMQHARKMHIQQQAQRTPAHTRRLSG